MLSTALLYDPETLFLSVYLIINLCQYIYLSIVIYFILVKIGKRLRIHQCLMGKYITIKGKIETEVRWCEFH